MSLIFKYYLQIIALGRLYYNAKFSPYCKFMQHNA